MIKTHKKLLIISSVMILLPILVGLLLWNQLPDTMATHWGTNGQVDGWGSKAFAIFVPPVIMLTAHWICVLVTAADKGNKNQNKKVTGMVLWIMPCVSLLTSAILYGIALGTEFDISAIMFAMLGLMFIGIGNYLPKVKHNHTIGIKISWTLASEENWNATHRFGGKVWVAGGFVILLMSFFPLDLVIGWLLAFLLILAFVPMIYSYLYYKKQQKEGTARVYINPMSKWNLLIAAAFLLFLFFVLFTGNIEYQYGDTSFSIDADRWNGLTVEYDAIDAIEYRKQMVSGSRENGFGSPRLLMGSFKNEEFGMFTRYTYGGCEHCIVITVDNKTLVISGRDAAETTSIYEELNKRIAG